MKDRILETRTTAQKAKDYRDRAQEIYKKMSVVTDLRDESFAANGFKKFSILKDSAFTRVTSSIGAI